MGTDGARIVAFYEGVAPDDRGRSLEEILSFDDARLEYTHDFIQWLFPLREMSGANPSAPRVDDGTVEQFTMRPELRSRMVQALDKMLEFYGLTREGGGIVKDGSFAAHDGWLRPSDHNHLRLTRMIKSLRLLGNEAWGVALFECLRSIYEDEQRSGRRRLTANTFAYWCDAAGSG